MNSINSLSELPLFLQMAL